MEGPKDRREALDEVHHVGSLGRYGQASILIMLANFLPHPRRRRSYIRDCRSRLSAHLIRHRARHPGHVFFKGDPGLGDRVGQVGERFLHQILHRGDLHQQERAEGGLPSPELFANLQLSR